VRRLGAVIPFFSLRREGDWGIGTFGDLAAFAALMKRARVSLVQVLPPHPLGGHETSPYGARSAFALDPLYLDLEVLADVPDSVTLRACGSLLPELRNAERVDYARVRACKRRGLLAATTWFLAQGGEGAPAFQAFEQSAWVKPYARYAALSEAHDGRPWQTWSHGLEPAEDAVKRECIAQYFCHAQWSLMRRALQANGTALMGDLPFILGADSADVWGAPHAFRTDASLGCPPDPFSETGQNWSLPAYDFADGKSALNFLRARAARAHELYDAFRVDHVVGYFRMWLWKTERDGNFDIREELEQAARGKAILALMQAASSTRSVIAEDLGVIPDFVRETLKTLNLPGYRVIPWERDEQGLRDPRQFPSCSVTTYGTHDTEPLLAWFDAMPTHEQQALCAMSGSGARMDEHALLKLAVESGSNLTLLLFQEVLGMRERINTPGTVSNANWSLRLPQSIEALGQDSALLERLSRVGELCIQAGRASGGV
jgi:4-alpha-glucanotransferase